MAIPYTVMLAVIYISGEVCSVPTEKLEFVFFNESKTWNEAYCTCQETGMDLMVLETSGKASVVRKIYQQLTESVSTDLWIGLYNNVSTVDGETNFVHSWVNGNILGSFAHWDDTEPDNETTELCVRMVANKLTWKTGTCSSKLGFVCEARVGECTLEGNFSSPAGSGNGVLQPISLSFCLDECRKNTACYAVVFNSNTCHIYEHYEDSLFMRFESLTGTAYRKICYEGAVALVYNASYKDGNDTPRLTCTYGISSTTSQPDSSPSSSPVSSTTSTGTTSSPPSSSAVETPIPLETSTLSKIMVRIPTVSNLTALENFSVTPEVIEVKSDLKLPDIPTNMTDICRCRCILLTGELNITVEEIEEAVEKLKVVKNSTSLYRRKKTSAQDERLSSQVVGSLGIIIVTTVLLSILLMDALTLGKRFINRNYNKGI